MLSLLIISILVFASVYLLVYGVFRYPAAAETPVNRRMARALGADRATVFEQPGLSGPLNLLADLANRIGIPFLRSRVRQDLDASGNDAGYTVSQYLALCLLSALVTAAVFALLQAFAGGGFLLVALPLGLAVGFYVPLALLAGARQRRVQKMARQLPYTLDLIALMMASGSSFNDAVQTLIRDQPNDELNQELRLAMLEVEYGSARPAALRAMADRIPLPALRSVVASVNQSESLGTPMASILKLQSDMLRSRRAVEAERKSASASLRILVPSMLIMMAVVLILFSPLIIRFSRGELF